MCINVFNDRYKLVAYIQFLQLQYSYPWFDQFLSSREAKDIMEVAAELGLTGKEYIWIMTSFCIGFLRNPNAPRVYPIGSLGKDLCCCIKNLRFSFAVAYY